MKFKNNTNTTEYLSSEPPINAEAFDPPTEDTMYDLADIFKVFGDSTRLKILFTLFKGEMCVQDIANNLNMTQSAISHQLKILKQNKLIKFRRNGKSIYYSLSDSHVSTVIYQGLNHLTKQGNSL